MMILDSFASFEPLWRAQLWAATHLLFMQDSSGDLRCDIVALAMRGISRRSKHLPRSNCLPGPFITCAAPGKAPISPPRFTAADTMVAAGDR